MGDINSEPFAVQALRDGDGGAAAAEGIKDDITLVAGCGDDALKQFFRFLGGVAEAFTGLRLHRIECRTHIEPTGMLFGFVIKVPSFLLWDFALLAV